MYIVRHSPLTLIRQSPLLLPSFLPSFPSSFLLFSTQSQGLPEKPDSVQCFVCFTTPGEPYRRRRPAPPPAACTQYKISQPPHEPITNITSRKSPRSRRRGVSKLPPRICRGGAPGYVLPNSSSCVFLGRISNEFGKLVIIGFPK